LFAAIELAEGKIIAECMSRHRHQEWLKFLVPQLIDAIQSFIAEHNRSPQSLEWTAKAADILEKVRRARAALDKVPSAGCTTLAFSFLSAPPGQASGRSDGLCARTWALSLSEYA
jgi:hypothetical protein